LGGLVVSLAPVIIVSCAETLKGILAGGGNGVFI
jgi:hypothetical protein